MESSLELLTEAANFVENQGRNGFEQQGTEAPSQPPTLHTVGRAPKENGDSAHNNTSYHPRLTIAEESKHAKDNRNVTHLVKPASDEPPRVNAPSKPENMRLNERSPGDETTMTNYNHSNGVLHQRIYQDERHLLSYRNCSTESPTRSLSPVAKRPPSPSNAADGEHGQRTMVLPNALTSLPSVGGHPMGHFAPHNPMLSFLHPYMLPTALDPNVCAETFARQQGLVLGGDVERQQQQSPGSSPSAASSSAGITAAAAAAALPGLMYPLAANPAYFMGARGSQTPGLGLADIPMLFPSQIAAYGANLLPGQVPAFGALSEQDKRLYESLPGLAQHTPAHLFTHPYFKSFCAPAVASSASGIDAATAKDAAAAAAAAAAGVAIPGVPGVDFLLKYQEALANEAMKMKGILSPRQSAPSPAARRSSSPEASKKPPLVTPYPFSVPFPPAYLTNPNASLSKSPAPERKVSTPTMGGMKNGNGVPPSHHHQQQEAARASREREMLYAANNELAMGVNGDEARRRLMALAQRPRNPADLYASPYKGPHDRTDRRSPSPYNDRRRISRERSPNRSMSADKTGKKRSHESSFAPDTKPRSPALPHQIDGNRSTKSPHRRSSSPMSRITPRHSQTTNPYLAVPGSKANPDKENPPYLTQTPPYVFPQTLGGFPTPPYALPSYLRQADPSVSSVVKSSMAGLAAPAFSTAQTSQLYRTPAPADAAAIAEYLRSVGIPPYAVLMPQQQQQQQALRHSVIAHSNPSAQGMMDKERGSPSVNPLLLASRGQAHNPGKLSSDSPVPQAQNSSHVGAGGKTAKLNYANSPYTYNAYGKSRTPPGYQEVPVKREANSPPASRRVSGLTTYASTGKVGSNSVRSSDEERANRLKRKVEEENERAVGGKEAGIKQRKREVNADASADIDEHFRRSLGEQYKKEVEPQPPSQQQQIVTITSTVDDHFQKALGGDVWSRLKPSNKSTSPEAVEGLDRRESSAFRGEGAFSAAHAAAMHPGMFLAVQGDRHMLAYAQGGKAPPNGNKTVKAKAIIYPEAPSTEPAGRTYSNNSSSGRSDRSSPPSKLDLGYTNPFVPESKARIAAYQTTSQSALNCRSTQSPVKPHPDSYNEHESARRLGASPGSKLPPPYTGAPTSYGGSPTSVLPPYSPQSSSSTSKSSPNRHVQSDGQSPTDLQDHHLQSMERSKSIYRPGLEAQQ